MQKEARRIMKRLVTDPERLSGLVRKFEKRKFDGLREVSANQAEGRLRMSGGVLSS
jgi:hypothetical protein